MDEKMNIKRILEQVQNGIMTVDEAEKYLRKESFNWTEGGSVVESPGAVHILMLIQLLQEELPGTRSESSDPSNE